MDATCTIQDSIHVFSLVHKYVSRILGTYHFESCWQRDSCFMEIPLLFFNLSCCFREYWHRESYHLHFPMPAAWFYLLDIKKSAEDLLIFRHPSALVLLLQYFTRISIQILNATRPPKSAKVLNSVS